MEPEQKQKLFEELMFKKKWGKHLKLSPIEKNISKNVGRAPKCNTKGPKKEVGLQVAPVAANGKKKKR